MIDDIGLQAVARFIEYDLENDKELLDIVELASAITKSPYALISFFDNDTQYLKVRKGTTETSVPRDISFCTHAIEQNGLMIVSDTLNDERFKNNPMVTGGPAIRFFASMPLTINEGHNVGTLCVLDTIPHETDDHQQFVMRLLGNQVMKIMELREGIELLKKKQAELQEQRELNNDANIRLRSFFESSTNF